MSHHLESNEVKLINVDISVSFLVNSGSGAVGRPIDLSIKKSRQQMTSGILMGTEQTLGRRETEITRMAKAEDNSCKE